MEVDMTKINVELNRNQFVVDGRILKDKNKNEWFYPCKEVNKFIKKLKKLNININVSNKLED
jgi:hypothetical protein